MRPSIHSFCFAPVLELLTFLRHFKTPFWNEYEQVLEKKVSTIIHCLITNYVNFVIASFFPILNFTKIKNEIKKSDALSDCVNRSVSLLLIIMKSSKQFPWPIWNSISHTTMIALSDRLKRSHASPISNAHLGQINIDFNFIQKRKWSY